MTYMPDDVVTTRDGLKHRVLWECKGAAKVYVKSVDVHGKGYMVKVTSIVSHQSKKDRK